MSMQTKIIGGIIAVAAAFAIVASYGLYRAPVAQAPGQTATSTEPAAATTSGQETTITEAPVSRRGPTIETTPFSVYLGGAVEFGTSSAELMGVEVAQAVVGYEWESLPGSVMFDSVILPAWDPENPDAEYEVYTWDWDTEEYQSLGSFPSGEEIQFPRDGLQGPSKFKVLGIDPGLRICPGKRDFEWIFRYTFYADTSFVRTPITQDLFFFQTCKMR